MATAEHAMWVTKRYASLRNETGFVKVPAALRASLIADGGAADVFDFRAFPDDTPLGPPITDIAFAEGAVQTDAVIGDVAGTLTVDGGTPPITYGLTGTDAETFTVVGNEVRVAVVPLQARVYSMFVTASDTGGRRFVDPLTVTVTAAAPPPAVASAAPASKASKK